MVHGKLMIIDDGLLRIGSANLSNRSMGLDTECDLCVAARADGARGAIAGLRRRLLGIFLGLDQESVATAEERENGLISAIESLRAQDPTLAPLSGETDPDWERQLPDDHLIDPDRPLNASDLSYAVVGQRSLPHARRRIWLGSGLVLALLVQAAAWRRTGLGDWLQPQFLAASSTALLHGPWGPGLIVAGFVLGSLIAVPVTLLILVSALIYGPALGALYAMVGSVVAAIATYGVGYYLGRPAVERLSGGSIERLSERLARRRILTVVAVRIVSVAPFTVINLRGRLPHRLAGLSVWHPARDVPGIAAMVVFAEGILALVRDADLKHFLVMALA
jgi:phospholipase D1/2